MTTINAPSLAQALDRFARDYGTPRTPSASHKLTGFQREALEDMALALGAHWTDCAKLIDPRLIALYSIARKSPDAAKRKLDEYLGHTSQPYAVPFADSPAPSAPQADLAPIYAAIDTLENKSIALFHDTGYLRQFADDTRDKLATLATSINAIAASTPKPVLIQLGEMPAIQLDTAHPTLPRVIRKLKRGRNVWLCGPRGSGKSFVAGQIAKVFGVACHIMTGADDQFALIGYFQPHDGSLVKTPFRRAWEEGGVICLDELDTYNPQAIIVMNDALANGVCTFPDGPIRKHPECYVMAGTNTDGRGADNLYSARSVLCGSTRDRFAFIPWGYDPAVETAMGAALPDWCRYVQAVRAYMDENAIDEAPSPRATQLGAVDILDGDTWEEAAEAYIWKGLSKDIQARVDRAVPIANFNHSIL